MPSSSSACRFAPNETAYFEQVNNTTGTATYLHHDQQNSIRLLTGFAGTATGSIIFDVYGNKIENTNTISPLGYDGQYQQRHGLKIP